MLRSPAPPAHPGLTGTPTAEWRRVVEAVAAVRREIERIRAVAARQVGPQEAQIFDAHLMLLDDAEVLADVKHRVNPEPVRSRPGSTRSLSSRTNGLNCQTPTCAPAPRTYGQWGTRCSLHSPARRPSP